MKIQSVHRALDIVCLFASYGPSLSLTEIAERLQLNKTTAYGLITSLMEKGFLFKNPNTKQYRLGSKVYELGLFYASSLEINRIGSGPAQALAEKTQQTPRIGILEGDFALVTLYALPGAQTNISSQIGPRLPLYCTTLGKVLLAFGEAEFLKNYLQRTELIRHTDITNTDVEKLSTELDETKKRGYAVGSGQFVNGQAGIAAPIWGYKKRLEGALAISGRRKEILGEKMDWYIEELLSTAASISKNMGYSYLN